MAKIHLHTKFDYNRFTRSTVKHCRDDIRQINAIPKTTFLYSMAYKTNVTVNKLDIDFFDARESKKKVADFASINQSQSLH